MTLSLFIAQIAWFSKKSTISSYDYDTFQTKIGQCVFKTGNFVKWAYFWQDPGLNIAPVERVLKNLLDIGP